MLPPRGAPAAQPPAGPDAYQMFLARQPQRSQASLDAQRRRFCTQPLISVLMPVYSPQLRHLRAAITSVQRQSYDRWELCMVDDASADPAVVAQLRDACAADERLKMLVRGQNGHICRASNDALAMCRGEFVALLDHDDELHPEALHQVVAAIDQDAEVDILFSDEDKVDDQGRRFAPHFKHGLNLDILWSQNFVSHLGVYRRSLLEAIGGFRRGLEGSQDHDLVLRALEHSSPSRVRHIPQVLYHWRASATSSAACPGAKTYASTAGRQAVADHLARTHRPAEVMHTVVPGVYQVRHALPPNAGKVALVIGGSGTGSLHVDAICALVRSVRRVELDVVVAATPEQFDRLRQQAHDRYARHQWLRIDTATLNLAELLNLGLHATDAEVAVIAAPTVRPYLGAPWASADAPPAASDAWLQELVCQALRPQVGVVGGRVLDCTGRVDSCGLVVGAHNLIGRLHHGATADFPGYMYRAVVTQEVSAVSAGLMALRREVWASLGGFDEQFRDDYHDVDFCLRARARKQRIVATPFATVQLSHALEDCPPIWRTGLIKLIQKHARAMRQDPFVSPHLSLLGGQLVLAPPYDPMADDDDQDAHPNGTAGSRFDANHPTA